MQPEENRQVPEADMTGHGAPVRVLYLEASIGGVVGGSLTGLQHLLRGLDRQRYAPVVVLYEEKQALQAELAQLGIPVRVYPKKRRGRHHPLQQVQRYQQLRQRRVMQPLLRSLWEVRRFLQETLPATFALRRIFKQEQPQLIHLCNGFRTNLDAIVAAWWCRIPCICHVKAFEKPGWIVHTFARAVDLGICMTAAVRDYCEAHGLKAKRMTVIYDGLDTEGFRPARDAAAVRKELGIALTAPLVGIVGNIQHWKGQAVVVEAIREVRAVVPEIRCLMVGGVHRNGAVYAQDLKRSIAGHDLQSHVICTGVREDVADLMAAMDIVIHASVAPEPFGRVILEGMALGKAVIATNIGGVPEFVQDTVTGRLVPPSDPQALARTIRELLGDAAYREQLGHQGRQEVRRRFDIQHHVEEITHAYASLRVGCPSEPMASGGRQESARRLVLVISRFSSGGAQRVLSILANAWAAKGWHITLLTLDHGLEPPFYDLHPAVRYRPLGLERDSSTVIHGMWNNLNRLRTLRQAIVQSTPQAVISFIDKPNILTLLATLGLRVPVIVSERIDPAHHPIGSAWNGLRSWVYPLCTCLVIQSQSALSYFSPMIQRRARVIPNPVLFPPEGEPTPQLANGASAKTVIAVGRLSEQKGFDLLLEAFAQVAPQHPEWSLVIWGEGAQRPHLERLRDDRGLQGRVSFPGLTRQPFEEMRQADLFVLSSRYEGFPNVLCEAMACGLPVISFDCPSGPREIVTDDIDGVLVPPGDVAALATAMARLMASELTRKRLAIQARRVTDRFDLAHVLEMWEKVVAEVTGATAEPVQSSYS